VTWIWTEIVYVEAQLGLWFGMTTPMRRSLMMRSQMETVAKKTYAQHKNDVTSISLSSTNREIFPQLPRIDLQFMFRPPGLR